MSIASIENKSKKIGMIMMIVCAVVFLIFMVMFFATTTKWYIPWIIISVLAFIAGTYFAIQTFLLSSRHFKKQLRKRRSKIRNYLRTENDRYYHKRGLHWKPSNECSYLILRNSYIPEFDEEEVWLTGRRRVDVIPWGSGSQMNSSFAKSLHSRSIHSHRSPRTHNIQSGRSSPRLK